LGVAELGAFRVCCLGPAFEPGTIGEEVRGAVAVTSAHADALELVRHARTGVLLEEKKVANNTVARLVDPEAGVRSPVAIRLHSTDVVTISPDNVVTLDTGGWRTVTTKERINRFAPRANLYSKRGVWMLSLHRLEMTGSEVADRMAWDALGSRFHDGIRYNAETGWIIADLDAVDAEEEREARRKELRRRVKAFVALADDPERNGDLIDQVLEGGDWGGDCWYCLMRTEDGKTLADASGDHYHLEQHLEDEYLVPSLFRNAFQERYASPSAGDRALWSWAYDLRSGRGAGRRAEVERAVLNYFVNRLVKGVR
jgi:hypothetical protein